MGRPLASLQAQYHHRLGHNLPREPELCSDFARRVRAQHVIVTLAVPELLQPQGTLIAVEAPQLPVQDLVNHNLAEELAAIVAVVVAADGAVVRV